MWLEADIYAEMGIAADILFTDHSAITGVFIITPGFLMVGMVGLGILDITIRIYKKKQDK
ncbi:MAG: hypothetical protein ACFFC7_09105 [Candidatus Hermodarchaeota archaeon]